MSELALIERIGARARRRPGTELGIGDDAALVSVDGTAVVTQDLLVEGVHFRRATTSARDLGHKALAVNLSDIAAMLKPGVLRADTIAAFQSPARLASGASSTYALGWTVSQVQLDGRPVRMVSHRGSPAGGTVTLLTFPGRALAVAAAANISEARGLQAYALAVADAFAGR